MEKTGMEDVVMERNREGRLGMNREDNLRDGQLAKGPGAKAREQLGAGCGGEEGVRSQLKLSYFGGTSVFAMITQELFDTEDAQVTTRSS